MESSPFDHPYRGGFVGKEHRFALTVYFEDTDTAGIVYHANYLRFFERARSDMLRAAGIDQRAAIDAGWGAYAVSEMDIKWRKSAKLDDDLVVVSRVTQSISQVRYVEMPGEPGFADHRLEEISLRTIHFGLGPLFVELLTTYASISSAETLPFFVACAL